MKRLVVMVVAVFLAGCATGPESVECWIASLEADQVVHDLVDVEVGLEGPVERIEILVGETVVATAEIPESAEDVVTVAWDTSTTADGSASVRARAAGGESEHLSEPVAVVVDNTAPVASIDVARLSVVEGAIELPVTLEEANLESARLLSREAGELMTIDAATSALSWDTTTTESRAHHLSLEVIDAAGHVTTSAEVPIVVANGGEEIDIEYYPSAWVSIPEDYDGTQEVHTRIVAEMPATPIRRVVAWLTWDPSTEWLLEFALGQGICPHRGVAYHAEESREGELLVDLAWDDVDPTDKTRVMSYDPDHPEDATTFPYNGDITTCGAFFGHVADMEPTDHLGERILVEARFIFIYE